MLENESSNCMTRQRREREKVDRQLAVRTPGTHRDEAPTPECGGKSIHLPNISQLARKVPSQSCVVVYIHTVDSDE